LVEGVPTNTAAVVNHTSMRNSNKTALAIIELCMLEWFSTAGVFVGTPSTNLQNLYMYSCCFERHL